MRVKVPSYKRRDGTRVSGYEYDRWRNAAHRLHGPPDGLVGVLDTGPLKPQLPRQASVREVQQEARNRPGTRGSFVTPLTQMGGAVAAGVAGAAGLTFIAAPVMLAVVATVLAPEFFERLFSRETLRKFSGENRKRRRAYRREAAELAERYPHWYGEVPEHKANKRTWLTWKTNSSVESNGVAFVQWKHESVRSADSEGDFFLYPGVDLSGFEMEFRIETPGVNVRGANLTGWKVGEGSNMDGGDFREVEAERSMWSGASLRYANFAGANLRNAALTHCDLEGANLEGADVTGAKLPQDLTKTNITGEQLDSLRYMGPGDTGEPYMIREVTVDEMAAAFGNDREALTVAMWAGDVEVRDRGTNKVVTGEFDPVEHYIPYWSLEATKQYAP